MIGRQKQREREGEREMESERARETALRRAQKSPAGQNTNS